MININNRTAEILLVEDNPGDVLLTQEAFADAHIDNPIHVVDSGEEAIAYLRKQGDFAAAITPDLVLLDLNMPGKDGREVLAEIKGDSALKNIPIVVVTSSIAERDVADIYDLHANGYIQKPIDTNQFTEVVKAIGPFRFSSTVSPED